METITAVHVALDCLDRMDHECSDFEANVLETVTRMAKNGRLPSAKQHRILCEMVEKYLDSPQLLRALQSVRGTKEILHG